MEDLRGRTALITGGGAGLGQAMVRVFADEGMNIVVADIEPTRLDATVKELEERQVKALGVKVDVTDLKSVEQMIDAAYATFGEVNVFCNNAGIVQFGPVSDSPQEDWDWLFKVNLWGVVNCIRTIVPRMRAQKGPGHIVNTSSLSGVFAVPGLGIYTASKYAVMGISETMRMELKKDDIGVSVLCPGPTPSRIGETARMSRPAGAPALDPNDPDANLTHLSTRTAEQVAQAVRDGVKANRLYIFSHSGGKISAQKRFDEMLDAFQYAPKNAS